MHVWKFTLRYVTWLGDIVTDYLLEWR